MRAGTCPACAPTPTTHHRLNQCRTRDLSVGLRKQTTHPPTHPPPDPPVRLHGTAKAKAKDVCARGELEAPRSTRLRLRGRWRGGRKGRWVGGCVLFGRGVAGRDGWDGWASRCVAPCRAEHECHTQLLWVQASRASTGGGGSRGRGRGRRTRVQRTQSDVPARQTQTTTTTVLGPDNTAIGTPPMPSQTVTTAPTHPHTHSARLKAHPASFPPSPAPPILRHLCWAPPAHASLTIRVWVRG